METIFDLLRKEKKIIDKMNSLRKNIVKEKKDRDANESELWIHTDFKAKGLTNEKTRAAYVTNQMGLLYPSFYETHKASLANLESELKWIRQLIDVMKEFGIQEIDLEGKDKSEKDKPKLAKDKMPRVIIDENPEKETIAKDENL